MVKNNEHTQRSFTSTKYKHSRSISINLQNATIESFLKFSKSNLQMQRLSNWVFQLRLVFRLHVVTYLFFEQIPEEEASQLKRPSKNYHRCLWEANHRAYPCTML